MKPVDFFLDPQSVYQKQYEALRYYYIERKTAKEVAEMFGYKHRGFTTIVSEFNAKLKGGQQGKPIFQASQKRKKTNSENQQRTLNSNCIKKTISFC